MFLGYEFSLLRSSFYKRNPNLSTFSSFIRKRSGDGLPESFSGFYGKRSGGGQAIPIPQTGDSLYGTKRAEDIPSSFSSFYGKIYKILDRLMSSVL